MEIAISAPDQVGHLAKRLLGEWALAAEKGSRGISEGDWAATRFVIRGTHRGEWLGIAPTGRVEP